MKPRNWKKYPIRVCQTMHECELCEGKIHHGDEYYDGGWPRRAHVKCVEEDLEKTRDLREES